MTTREASRQRGVVLIWVGMFLLGLLAFLSLGADMAKLLATHTQLQNAADAAALAGASAIDPATGTIVDDTAVARAQLTSSRNNAFVMEPVPVALAAADVEILTENRVRVTVRREGASSIVTHFAQVIGIPALQTTATATAQAAPVGEVPCGVVPLAVSPGEGLEFQTGCTPGYTLKFGGGAGSNGNFGALDFPPCDDGPCAGMPATGASTFRCLVRNGYCCSVRVGQALSTEPGNMSSFRKAIEDRFADDTDSREGICHAQYTGNGSRVMFVPVTSDVGDGTGRHPVTVLRFAAFFIKNIPGSGVNSTLTGEFLYQVIPGTGDTDPVGPVAYTLRLID